MTSPDVTGVSPTENSVLSATSVTRIHDVFTAWPTLPSHKRNPPE